ncbi:glycosyltransferase family 2 protein [Spirochaetota bacterium]
MDLSIVIPALNEASSLPHVIKAARRGLKKLKVKSEIIVVDNGSTDATPKVARRFGARVITEKQKGYGYALRSGIRSAKGKKIIIGDADGSYDLSKLRPFYDKLHQGYDLVMGSRLRGIIYPGAMSRLHRYIGTPVLTFLLNFLFKIRITDLNCGMRGFNRKLFLELKCRTGGMEFASEMIIKAALAKLNIYEVPCDLYPDERKTESHLNTWSDGWRHLRLILLLSPSFLFFTPGILFTITGVCGFILIPNHIFFLDQKHLISSLVLLLIGSQILQFGFIAKVFSYLKIYKYTHKFILFLIKQFTLERGLLCGNFFIMVGVLGLLFLLFTFLKIIPISFSDILLRFKTALAAIASLMIGLQIVFTSFVLGIIQIEVD